MDPCKLVTHRQPADWLNAWKQAAEAEGKTLSEWIGDQCNKALPKEVRKELGKRPKAGRRW